MSVIGQPQTLETSSQSSEQSFGQQIANEPPDPIAQRLSHPLAISIQSFALLLAVLFEKP